MRTSTVLLFIASLIALLPAAARSQAIYGETSLEYDQGYLFAKTRVTDGSTAYLLIDIGSPTTGVTGHVSGVGTIQRPNTGATQDARPGTALGGFGLPLAVLGDATVTSLQVGSIVFPQVNVRVLQSMPDVAGRTVVGIVGLDLLRRAEIATLHFGSSPRLALQSRARTGAGAVVPVEVKNGVLTAKGSINGAEVQFVLDTGSPESFLSPTGVAGSNTKLQLADGSSVPTRRANVRSFSVGTSGYTGVDFHIAELPVFSQATGSTALLGNSFFSGLTRVELHFTAGNAVFVSE
jgi:hypothetical protein